MPGPGLFPLDSDLHSTCTDPAPDGKEKTTKYSWAGNSWQFFLDFLMIYDVRYKFSPCFPLVPNRVWPSQQRKEDHVWEIQPPRILAGVAPTRSFLTAQGVPACRNNPSITLEEHRETLNLLQHCYQQLWGLRTEQEEEETRGLDLQQPPHGIPQESLGWLLDHLVLQHFQKESAKFFLNLSLARGSRQIFAVVNTQLT